MVIYLYHSCVCVICHYAKERQCRLSPKAYIFCFWLPPFSTTTPKYFSKYWQDDNSRSVDAARVRGVLWWRRGLGPSVSMRTSAGAGVSLAPLAPLATILLLLLPPLRAQDIFSGSNSLGKG